MIERRFFAALFLGAFALTLHAEEPAGAIQYTVQPGDTISGISERYLGGSARWGAIARMNPGLDIHKLRPGQTLYLPEKRVLSEGRTARVLKVNGHAKSNGVDLQEGEQLEAGAEIDVAEDSFVTLQLDDDTILLVEPNTKARLDELREWATGARRSSIRIDNGRVDVKAPKRNKPGARFEIMTPSATTTVRGTWFRVGESDKGMTVVEVNEGRVRVAARKTGAHADVSAGHGMVLAAGQTPVPQPLLPAPDLSALPAHYTKAILEISFPPVPNAAAYRIAVARDAAFNDVVVASENVLPQLKVAGLPDGEYYLRARAISAEGLHGLESDDVRFLLHARPEPPFALSPVLGKRVAAGSVTLTWAVPENVNHYDIHISRDGQPLLRVERHPEPSYTLEAIPGEYAWQLAARDVDDRLGPFGSQTDFTVVDPPKEPEVHTNLAEDRSVLTLIWRGEPDQTYHWQLAADSEFMSIVKEGDSQEPGIQLPTPDAGTYFVRVRATTGDGIQGSYSSIQKLVIPEEENGFPVWALLFLLPLFAL